MTRARAVRAATGRHARGSAVAVGVALGVALVLTGCGERAAGVGASTVPAPGASSAATVAEPGASSAPTVVAPGTPSDDGPAQAPTSEPPATPIGDLAELDAAVASADALAARVEQDLAEDQ